MYKKKDKFKTIGSQMRIKNIKVNDIDDIDYFESSKDTRTKSSKRTKDKGEQTLKTNVHLESGRIVEVNSNYSYKVNLCGDVKKCFLSGRLKYLDHDTRNPITVGDYVNVEISDLKNIRIEEILLRKNALSRFIEKKEVLLAANIDQVVIVVSVKEPDFISTLIDRYITVAEISNIPVIICINKIDLLAELVEIKDECAYYENCGYKLVYTSTVNNTGIDSLRELLKDKDSLFTGHSGTGKSSIINAIEPSLNLKTKEVSVHNKGTHTTTNSSMIAWSFGGYLVDTPGIKTIGLCLNDLEYLPLCFPGFGKYKKKCAFSDCSHTHEENCVIKEKVNSADIPIKRYNSYIKMRSELRG